MGIISIEQTNRLYWLGRYAERTYTTIRLFTKSYDSMLDGLPGGYQEYCRLLEIPDIYGSKENFIRSYAYDRVNVNSIASNLNRAYDNAIVLREEIGSEALSYIQLAIYEMGKAEASEAPMIELQSLLDDLLAFWGIVDDSIPDEKVRTLLKIGKRIERLDLYARLKQDKEDLIREYSRLAGRLGRSSLPYDKTSMELIAACLDKDSLDYRQIVSETEKLLEV